MYIVIAKYQTAAAGRSGPEAPSQGRAPPPPKISYLECLSSYTISYILIHVGTVWHIVLYSFTARTRSYCFLERDRRSHLELFLCTVHVSMASRTGFRTSHAAVFGWYLHTMLSSMQ